MNTNYIVAIYASKSLKKSIYDTFYIPDSPKFVAIGADGQGQGYICVMDTHRGEVRELHTATHDSMLRCGKHLGRRDELATGDLDGQICIWDTNRMNYPKSVIQVSDELVSSVDYCDTLGLVSCGCMDGSVVLWDHRARKIVKKFEDEAPKHSECWAVAMDSSLGRLALGREKGDFELFDLRKSYGNICKHQLDNGVCSIEFGSASGAPSACAVSCTNSEVHIFDMVVLNPETGLNHQTYTLHDGATVWKARFAKCPKGSPIVLTCGGDGDITVNELKGTDLKLLSKETISSQPITSMDWNSCKAGLFVCSSLDQSVYSCFVTDM